MRKKERIGGWEMENRQAGENYVNDCKEKQGEKKEARMRKGRMRRMK